MHLPCIPPEPASWEELLERAGEPILAFLPAHSTARSYRDMQSRRDAIQTGRNPGRVGCQPEQVGEISIHCKARITGERPDDVLQAFSFWRDFKGENATNAKTSAVIALRWMVNDSDSC